MGECVFPVMLHVRGRHCLVVGGGGVAVRKVESLVAEGAHVTVVAPAPQARLQALAEAGTITLERRPYRPGEAGSFALVFAATDDREVNRHVFEDAEASGIWANVADDPELCSFHLPARVRRGDLQLTISSSGEAPFATRRLRQMLERRFGQEWGEWLAAAAEFRRRVRRLRLAPGDEEALFDAFFAATVLPSELRCRVPSAAEVKAWLGATPATVDASGGIDGLTVPKVEAAGTPGLVSLVGAGPGDPGLLTLRGWRRLHAADAVVYDRLAEPALPPDLDDRIELHCVGKVAGNHPTPQEEINGLLVRLARQGKRVVRFKGGDPFVFGRGGEEGEALAQAGVPFEVVPGVTAGVAVPAYAGVPVTHRREAVRVTFLTAHETIKSDGPQVRWDLLARDAHASIVGYMGVTSLPTITERLLAEGMAPETPAAIIERGTTAAQRVVSSTLHRLAADAAAAGIAPPALFVISPAVRHRAVLDWFSHRPLAGERLLLPAPSGELADALDVLGAEVIECPLPLTQATRLVVAAAPLSGCVLSSRDEVELLDGERSRAGWEGRVTAWCRTREAAERARQLGWRDVEEVGESPAAVLRALGGRRCGG